MYLQRGSCELLLFWFVSKGASVSDYLCAIEQYLFLFLDSGS